jgi:hypothetical protein
MATLAPGEYKTNWDFSGGQTSVGNPLDLGPWRNTVQGRGSTYDDRANAAYGWGLEKGADLDATGKAVTETALDTSKAFNEWAKADRGFWEGTYKPAMQQQMDFARQYGTPARREANRGAAMADVGMTFDAAADMSKRALMGYGVDPSSGRYAGLDAGLAAARAKALAGAGTKSDRDTEMLGQEYLARAINTGARLPDQAVNQAGVGMAAGNQAINTGLATAQGMKALREPTGWVNAGDQALRDWKEGAVQQTNLGMQQNRDAMEAYLAQEKMRQGGSSGMGGLMGAGMGILGQFMGGSGGSGGGIMNMFSGMGGGGGQMASLGGADMAMSGLQFRRGGRVPGKVQKFAWGGMAAPDIKPIDWGGGQAFDPYDPMASAWGAFDNDNPELEDNEGEGLGRGIGGTAGGLIGSIWGPIGSMAGREIGQKLGGGIGAAVQGDWGGAAESLVEGTPLDFIFAEGGEVPDDDEFVDTPDDEMMGGGAQPSNIVPPEASPSGGAETDDVHALVNEGEFIVPKKVVNWHGEKFFQKLIEKAYAEMQNKTAEPEQAPVTQAMAIAPPSFQSAGV